MTDEQETNHAVARYRSNVGLGKLLTQSELNALPEGTEVIVIWGGGNGPHKYKISVINGYADIYSERGAWIGTPEVWKDKVWLPNEQK